MTLTPHTLFFVILILCSSFERATGSEITLGQGLKLLNRIKELTTAPQSDCQNNPAELAVNMMLINDNKPWSLADGAQGDDMGHTHGYRLNFSYLNSKKQRVVIFLTNDLYTEFNDEPSWRNQDGIRFAPQFFAEEIRAGASFDTFDRDDPIYLRLGGGIHRMNYSLSDDMLLSTAKQQTEFHHAVNQSGIVPFNERVQRSNGKESQIGFFASANVGYKRQVFNLNNGLLELIVYADAGLDLSSIPDASALVVNSGIRVSSLSPNFGLGRIKQSLELVSENRFYKEGMQSTPRATILIGHENAQLIIGYEKDIGEGPQYRLYDNPNITTGKPDDMLTVGLRFALSP